MVKCIEKLSPELKVVSFADFERFEGSQIRVPIARVAQNPNTRVPWRANCVGTKSFRVEVIGPEFIAASTWHVVRILTRNHIGSVEKSCGLELTEPPQDRKWGSCIYRYDAGCL